MENEVLTKEQFAETLDKSLKDVTDSIDERLKGLSEEIDKIKVTPSQEEEDKLLKGGFDNLGEFAKSAISSKNGLDTKMKNWMNVNKTFNEGTDSDGGFTVPPQFSGQLYSLCLAA